MFLKSSIVICYNINKLTYLLTYLPRLRFRCRYMANWTKHTHCPRFWPIRSIIWKHDVIHKTGIHNILHCLRGTELYVQKIWWNLNVFFKICERTDRQKHAYRHADHNTSNPNGGRRYNKCTHTLTYLCYTYVR